MSGKKLTCFDCGQVNRVPADKLMASPKCGTCGAKLMGGKAAEIDLKTLQKAARTDDVPLIADFWAPWCAPCKVMNPVLEQFSELNPDNAVIKVDVDQKHEIAARFGVRAIPTLVPVP